MTEPTENKPSVVDDFFSALFANHSSSSTKQEVSPAPIEEKTKEETKIEENMETEKELDEFDEYSLLSRKQGDVRRASRFLGDTPAQILAKRDIDWSLVSPESRMLVRQLPKSVDKQEIMDYFTKYGEVIEVVQKNSFGFVHFENPDACARAVKEENGKIYNGVILDLEICKKKPYFARVQDDGKKVNTLHRSDNSPPSRRRDYSPNRSRSRSPPRNHNRRTSAPRNNNNSSSNSNSNNSNNRPGNTPRNRPSPQYSYHNLAENTNHRYDYPRRNDTRRPEPHYHQGSILPPRNGNGPPTVQIVSWSSAYYSFASQVEKIFAQYAIRTAAAIVKFSQSNRDEIIKQMVLEGVKGLIIIDSLNESKRKVYLQVFTKNENGEGARYDEYDSITPIEAVNILQRSQTSYISQQYGTANQYQYNSYNQQAQYNPQPTLYAPQPNFNNSPQPYVAQPQATSIDPNTITTLINLLQPKSATPQPTVVANHNHQPSVPQLLATLMNGLNVNKLATAPQTAPSIDQNNIASLLSTASNGNPAIAQLLYQMTAGKTNTPPPQPQSQNQSSPNITTTPTSNPQTTNSELSYQFAQSRS